MQVCNMQSRKKQRMCHSNNYKTIYCPQRLRVKRFFFFFFKPPRRELVNMIDEEKQRNTNESQITTHFTCLNIPPGISVDQNLENVSSPSPSSLSFPIFNLPPKSPLPQTVRGEGQKERNRYKETREETDRKEDREKGERNFCYSIISL